MLVVGNTSVQDEVVKQPQSRSTEPPTPQVSMDEPDVDDDEEFEAQEHERRIAELVERSQTWLSTPDLSSIDSLVADLMDEMSSADARVQLTPLLEDIRKATTKLKRESAIAAAIDGYLNGDPESGKAALDEYTSLCGSDGTSTIEKDAEYIHRWAGDPRLLLHYLTDDELTDFINAHTLPSTLTLATNDLTAVLKELLLPHADGAASRRVILAEEARRARELIEKEENTLLGVWIANYKEAGKRYLKVGAGEGYSTIIAITEETDGEFSGLQWAYSVDRDWHIGPYKLQGTKSKEGRLTWTVDMTAKRKPVRKINVAGIRKGPHTIELDVPGLEGEMKRDTFGETLPYFSIFVTVTLTGNSVGIEIQGYLVSIDRSGTIVLDNARVGDLIEFDESVTIPMSMWYSIYPGNDVEYFYRGGKFARPDNYHSDFPGRILTAYQSRGEIRLEGSLTETGTPLVPMTGSTEIRSVFPFARYNTATVTDTLAKWKTLSDERLRQAEYTWSLEWALIHHMKWRRGPIVFSAGQSSQVKARNLLTALGFYGEDLYRGIDKMTPERRAALINFIKAGIDGANVAKSPESSSAERNAGPKDKRWRKSQYEIKGRVVKRGTLEGVDGILVSVRTERSGALFDFKGTYPAKESENGGHFVINVPCGGGDPRISIWLEDPNDRIRPAQARGPFTLDHDLMDEVYQVDPM